MTKWDTRFIRIAREVSTWSSCLRRHVGAVIVRDKRIITTGYNGAPANCKTCYERRKCLKDELKLEHGTGQDKCYATHAEQNALIQAAKLGQSIEGCTLYCTHAPCATCAKLIINAGITHVVYEYSYPDEFGLSLLEESGVKIEKYENYSESSRMNVGT